MPKDKQRPVVLKARLAQEQFRYEIARELGFSNANEVSSGKSYNRTVITGEMAKRMVNLAEQQIKGDSL